MIKTKQKTTSSILEKYNAIGQSSKTCKHAF